MTSQNSFQNRELPPWFSNAKLGIFIHWGLYSVPAWAPVTGSLADVVPQKGWEYWFKNNPYAEWYASSMRLAGGATEEHHAQTYGPQFPYSEFRPRFLRANADWDASSWAEIIADAGARYAVLTTKHHDGFCLWPSSVQNPMGDQWFSSRDYVGEFTSAMRQRGLEPGLYYSGGLDFTFNSTPITDLTKLFEAVPQSREYVRYARSQFDELIDRYSPSVIWNDIGCPADFDVPGFFRHYYDKVPQGVVNDRFATFRAEDAEQHAASIAQGMAPAGQSYDFRTPEYASFSEIQSKKWEATRGLAFSFGYNQNDDDSNMLSAKELIHLLVDVVSKNGNLLINIGPRADGSIPENQRHRLAALGHWLRTNGPAIYDTTPWHLAEASTDCGVSLRYTAKPGVLYAILLDKPVSNKVSIRLSGISKVSSVHLLETDLPLPHTFKEGTLSFQLPASRMETEALTIQISHQQ